MYSIDGDFGKVRHIPLPIGFYNLQTEVPFCISNGGWHCCNEKYHFDRESGLNSGHLLFFSLSDGGRLQLDNEDIIEIPASSATWIPPGIPHSYFTAIGENWEFYWLHVEDTPALHLKSIFTDDHCISISCMQEITLEIEGLISFRNKNPREFQIEFSRRFSNIYHYLLQESSQQIIQQTKIDPLVREIIHEMDTACHMDWNLPQLSQKYYISVPQLIRRFRSETGMTPYAYLMHIRLQTAEMYLRYTTMSVDEISRKTGFSTTSNFIMQFSKIYGNTPLKYRNN
ncbi:MAG: AraC family transcriptional regulator [Lachnospiraceae bacterium]|nr:AraC family transcriptional regulator [Lachnospiraceae bacterium]